MGPVDESKREEMLDPAVEYALRTARCLSGEVPDEQKLFAEADAELSKHGRWQGSRWTDASGDEFLVVGPAVLMPRGGPIVSFFRIKEFDGTRIMPQAMALGAFLERFKLLSRPE